MSGQALQTFLLNMLDASVVTLEVFFLTLLFSLPLGLVFAAARMSRRKWVRVPMESFLLIIRGTPLILQLIFFYFVPPDLLGIGLPRFWAAILAFSINYAAYFAEIVRGGIQAIDPGQIEAAKVLGFGKMQTVSYTHLDVYKRQLYGQPVRDRGLFHHDAEKADSLPG